MNIDFDPLTEDSINKFRFYDNVSQNSQGVVPYASGSGTKEMKITHVAFGFNFPSIQTVEMIQVLVHCGKDHI